MSHRATILIIEDEPMIRAGVVAGLERSGYAVREATTFADGQRASIADGIDLILLDLVLPGGDGLDLLAQVRAQRPERPILIMTARGSTTDRVRGLNLGADDYVVKPFGLDELQARVEAVLRRSGTRIAPCALRMTWDGGAMDLSTGTAQCGERTVTLSAQERDVLKLLAERRDRAVSREELLGLLWRCGLTGLTSRAIDMAVLRLRDKLGDDAQHPRVIATVRSVGYRFVAQVVS